MLLFFFNQLSQFFSNFSTESSFEYYNTAKTAQIILETIQQYPGHHLEHATNTSTFVIQ